MDSERATRHATISSSRRLMWRSAAGAKVVGRRSEMRALADAAERKGGSGREWSFGMSRDRDGTARKVK